MADRTILLAQNGRHALRGLTQVNPQEFSAYQEVDDSLTYIIDMSSYLDGDTISSVTRTASGPLVSNTSNTTTRVTQRLSGFGYVDFKVTTTAGDVEEFRITLQPRGNSAFFLTHTGSQPDNTARFFATETEAAGTNPVNVSFIWTAGKTTAGDGKGGLYKLSDTLPGHSLYFTTNNGKYYERTTWGNQDGYRGHFTATTAGANIWRFGDRVLIAEAAQKWGATASGVPDSGTSWLSDSTLGPAFIGVGSMLLVTTPENTDSGGRYAITGAAKLSSSTNSSGIGVGGILVNNKAGASGWALYADITHNTTGISHGLEVASKNASSSNLTATPYTDNNGVYGVWLAGGGDNSYGPAAANPSNAAMVVLKNAHTWNVGIVFKDDALTGTDGTSGSTGTGVAVAMSRRHSVRWYDPTNSSTGAEIISSVTTSASAVSIDFSDDEIKFKDSAGTQIGGVKHSGTVANWLALVGRPTTAGPQIEANGSDADIDIFLKTKGAGQVRFGTVSALGAEVLSGYILMKDAGGTIRKLAVIS